MRRWQAGAGLPRGRVITQADGRTGVLPLPVLPTLPGRSSTKSPNIFILAGETPRPRGSSIWEAALEAGPEGQVMVEFSN